MKVLKNAKVYTVDKEIPWASVIVLDGNEIAYVGDTWEGPGDEYDLSGKMILPGFIDSHVHPGMVSKSAWHVRLPWTKDVGELLDFIAEYGEKYPKEEIPFLYFEYYPTSIFDEKGPRKELLDQAISDRPVLCQDFGEHLCWVNSKMLELMGVDENTPDPSTLEAFVRDSNGKPTGWIKEMAWLHFADNMYKAINWSPPEYMDVDCMKPFFDFMTDSGITALFDAFIENDQQIKSIYEMDQMSKLAVYYDGSVRFWTYQDLPEKIQKVREYQKLYTTEHIKVNTLKLFLDGTNESGNSASLHEHIHDPGNYGEIMMEVEELVQCFVLCNKEGLDLHIHIVGDRAFRTGCDAVEAAQKIASQENVPWVCQPVFAHCEIIDPADMARAAQLGIIINWTCHWSGGYFGEEAQRYFTEDKWRRMYQFNQMIDSGALVAFSSDVVTRYEMHRAYPFFGMQVAATRVDPEFPLDPQRYPGSIRPEESARLDLDTLIKGYTIQSARQLRWSEKIGSLEKGKRANLIVIDQDVFTIPLERLKDVIVETVIFDGNVIKGKL